jgi:signal transduction histidine kinase
MSLLSYPANIWSRLTFAARLLAISTLALLVAGATMLLVSTQQGAREARIDLTSELAQELETLPAALAEAVVIGDFASLQQQLDRYAMRPDVASLQFVDSSGKTLQSRDKPQATNAPDWFFTVLQFEDVAGSAAIKVGGRSYGSVHIGLSAHRIARRAWLRMTDQLLILFLALSLDFLGLWWALRSGLAPLKRLKNGAEAIADGALDTRLKAEGSPELRTLIASFNRMATVTQRALERLRQSNADLQRFAEVTAHHLQEPARRMANYAERLTQQLAGKLDDPEAQLSLDFIGQQARRQQNLLRDVERYLAADQPRGVVETVDAQQVVQGLLARWKARIDLTGAAITLGTLPAAWIDRPRLNDLFEVALDNALSHGRSARPLQIVIEGKAEGGKTCYSVSDNGAGVEAQYRERVFRVFERLAPGGDSASTGIGLAILRRMTESCGGAARLETSASGGACLVFELATEKLT